MARLFEDSFDQYGSSTTTMLDGVYATVGGMSLSTAHPATGPYGVYVNAADPGLNNERSLRKVLPASKDKMGAMARFYFDGLPNGNTGGTIFDFLSSDPQAPQVTCLVDSNGCLRFLRGRSYFTTGGENGTLIAKSDPIIVPGAQNHIEVQTYIHDTAGWVRAAVNGVHRFQATGLDTKVNGDNIVSVSQSNGITGSFTNGPFYMDDYVLYDFTGNSAVDTDFCPAVDGGGLATNYIGELDVRWHQPNGNTAQDQWSKSTGTSAYPLVATPPNDSTYIYSTAVNDLTELDLEDLPLEITYIRGLTIWGRMSKSDSGVAMTKFGMKSVAASTDASDRPVTQAPTYWWDQVNKDPNTTTRWSRSGFNASKVRLTRSL